MSKLQKWFVLLFFAIVSLSSTAIVGGQEKPFKRVAIVIDDFGNDMTGTKEILDLPIPLTIAVMPFLPTTKRDAEWAHQKGHEVFVHLPMEPVRGKKSWLGPGAITADLSNDEVRRRVHAAIDDVPYAIGMNNHMGSKITADPRIMKVILEVCKERNLSYLDSKTTSRSVVKKIANEIEVPLIENHVFLDEVYRISHISKQLDILHRHLQDHNKCIAIGHVGPPGLKTAAVLKEKIPFLQEEAQFVPASELLMD